MSIPRLFAALRHATAAALAGWVTLGAAAAPAAEPDALDPEDFVWRQPISGPLVSGRLLRIRVPAEVFNGCQSYPADIRVADAAGRTWPFFIEIPESREEERVLRTEAVNAVEAADPAAAYVRRDFVVLPTGPRRTRHNRIRVFCPGSDFMRRVEVFGAETPGEWLRLGEGYVVNQTAPFRMDNRVVDYPVSDLPHLQVRIHPNARNASADPGIDRIEVIHRDAVEGAIERLPLRLLPLPDEKPRPGVQLVEYDTGFSGRSFKSLRISATGAYARPIRVYGRASETNDWRLLAASGIHRMGDQTRDEVPLGGATARLLRLELFHYDDAPLAGIFAALDAAPQHLLLEARTAGPAWLYYGSRKFGLPQYDLARRAGRAAVESAPEGGLGAQELNPRRMAQGLARYSQWLVLLAVGFTAVLVLGVVLNMLRNRPEGNGP
jgi:hypothetical protein